MTLVKRGAHPQPDTDQRNFSHTSIIFDGTCGLGSCNKYVIVSGQWGCGCINEQGNFINTNFAVVTEAAPCKRIRNNWFNCNGDPELDCYNQVIDNENSFNCSGAPPPPSPTPTPCPQTD